MSPGTGNPKEPRRCSGWSVSSPLMRHTLPVSGGAQHVVAQLEVGRTDRLGQERMQVARADRREVARRERRVGDQRRDRRRVAVGELRALALDEVERLDRIGRGREHSSVAPATSTPTML